tara:strand:+ start:4424 stop:5638 length:1215 start_codon:yes stop_codon:yes gene_type:complete
MKSLNLEHYVYMNEILEISNDVLDDVISVRREIHAHPELNLENPETQKRILESLKDLPVEIKTGTNLTSVIADLKGTKTSEGPTMLLRADTDALPMDEDSGETFCSVEPGRAHACGHDAHTAMLIGAAKVLSKIRDQFSGTVRFMFQPGEEGAGGARIMIDEGVLEDVDRAFAIHVTPNLPAGFVGCRPGAMLASTDELKVTITGKGGHASTPHLCADPIPPMASMITALQTAVTREINAFDPALITIAHIEAGTTTNVIPETAFFEGTIRCVSENTRNQIKKSVVRVCDQIAKAHECHADVSITEGYPVTFNDAREAARFALLCEKTIGEGSFFEFPSPVMGGEDFSYLLQEVPGVMAFLGVCPEDISDSLTAPPCHSNRMRINESALLYGVALHTAVVLEGV